MIYLNTFEGFKIGKSKRIKSDYKEGDKLGVTAVFGDLPKNKFSNKKEILKKILKSVAKRFNIKKVKYMDAGAFGMAFIADDDKIIKLTSAEGEAASVKKVIGKDIPSCIKYYDMVFIDKYHIWAILMDKAESLTYEERVIFDKLLIIQNRPRIQIR